MVLVGEKGNNILIRGGQKKRNPFGEGAKPEERQRKENTLFYRGKQTVRVKSCPWCLNDICPQMKIKVIS